MIPYNFRVSEHETSNMKQSASIALSNESSDRTVCTCKLITPSGMDCTAAIHTLPGLCGSRGIKITTENLNYDFVKYVGTREIRFLLIAIYVFLNIFITLMFMVTGNKCKDKLTQIQTIVPKQSKFICKL